MNRGGSAAAAVYGTKNTDDTLFQTHPDRIRRLDEALDHQTRLDILNGEEGEACVRRALTPQSRHC